MAEKLKELENGDNQGGQTKLLPSEALHCSLWQPAFRNVEDDVDVGHDLIV